MGVSGCGCVRVCASVPPSGGTPWTDGTACDGIACGTGRFTHTHTHTHTQVLVFRASSLLFVDGEEGQHDVRMIDFAHTHPSEVRPSSYSMLYVYTDVGVTCVCV